MEDSRCCALTEVNIKEERPDYDSDENKGQSNEFKTEYNTHVVYLPDAFCDLEVKSPDFALKKSVHNNIHIKSEPEETDTLCSVSKNNFTNKFESKFIPVFPINIKTENCDLDTNVDVNGDMGVIEKRLDCSAADFGHTETVGIAESYENNIDHLEIKSEDCENITTSNGNIHVTLTCSLCNKNFASQQILFEHTCSQREKNCAVCGELYIQKLVKGKKRLRCTGCNKTHKKKHILPQTTEYECRICQKKYCNAGTLKVHELIHTGVKPHDCGVCEKKFTQAGDLKRHMLIHTGVKSHECKICMKKFNRSSLLNIHMLIHTGTKRHECNICHKKFSHGSTLTRHELVHTGAKPHECIVCQKKFQRQGDVKRHMLIHTGDKPYECDICLKKFRQIGCRNQHMLIHTKVKAV